MSATKSLPERTTAFWDGALSVLDFSGRSTDRRLDDLAASDPRLPSAPFAAVERAFATTGRHLSDAAGRSLIRK